MTIAQQTGGQYFRADTAQALQQVYTVIDELEPSIVEEVRYTPVEELYAWPLAAGLLMSLLMALRAARPPTRIGVDGDLRA